MTVSSNTVVSIVGQTSRDAHRWLLALVMLSVLALGWKYPLVGYVVPAAMLTGLGGSLFRGRYVCGNLCPRGSFYDTFFSLLGGSRPLPPLLQSMGTRWTVVVALMGFMVWRLLQNPADPLHWGLVFWQMCLVTTVAGVVLGLIWHPRAWCGVCPIGTLQNVIGGQKYRLAVDASCVGCTLCERSCPMGLTIAEYKGQKQVPHRDCLKCSSCVNSCPRDALGWPKAA